MTEYGVKPELEDNIWWDLPCGQKASNIDFVKRVHKFIQLNGHTLMSTREFGDFDFYNSIR